MVKNKCNTKFRYGGYAILLCSIFIFTLYSCGWVKNIGYNSADRAGKSVDQIANELFPLDSAGRNLILGLISGATEETSVQNMEKLSSRLIDTLFASLAHGLVKLNLDSFVKQAIRGASEELASDSVQWALNELRSGLEHELDTLIKGLFKSFSSSESRKNIENAVSTILSEHNKELVGSFVSGVVEKIEFDSLGIKLRSSLLNEDTKNAITNSITAPLDATLAKMQTIIDSLNKQNEKWWEKYFWQLIAGISLLAGILSWLYIQRRKALQNQKSLEQENINLRKQFQFNEQLNNIMMAEIDQIKQSNTLEDLTSRIKRKAIEHGIEPEVHEKLNRLRLTEPLKWNS
ncbi:MAG: hypothetical protein IPM34_00870 [Saprospiraceae bacterium]|nr:hypothetical protein [Saprospiraceae bacterium]